MVSKPVLGLVPLPFGTFLTNSVRLRVHPKQEWSDLYSDESTQDLRRFLDYYTKDKPNGWTSTPPVRVSLLPFNDVKCAILRSWMLTNGGAAKLVSD